METGEVTVLTGRVENDWNYGWAGLEWLLIASLYGEDWDMYALRVDGSERLRLSCTVGAARYPRWTPQELP